MSQLASDRSHLAAPGRALIAEPFRTGFERPSSGQHLELEPRPQRRRLPRPRAATDGDRAGSGVFLPGSFEMAIPPVPPVFT